MDPIVDKGFTGTKPNELTGFRYFIVRSTGELKLLPKNYEFFTEYQVASYYPPKAPLTVLTNLFTNPSFETISAGSAVLRVNYCLRPGTSFSYRTYGAAGGLVDGQWVANAGPDGIRGAWLTTTTQAPTAPNGGIQSVYGQTGTGTQTPVTAGDSVSFSCMGMIDNGLDSVSALWNFLDASGATIGGARNGPSVPVDPGVWVQVKMENVTVPANATQVLIGVHADNAAGVQVGAAFWLADPILEVGTVAGPFFDGDMLPAGDYWYDWTSTVQNSPSRQRGFNVAGVSNAQQSGAIRSSEWANDRQYSMRIIPTENTPNSTAIFDPTPQDDLTGRCFTVRATIRLAAPQTGIANAAARLIRIAARVGDSWNYQYARSDQPPNETGEYDMAVTAQLPEGCLQWKVYLYNGAAQYVGDVWWDGLMIVEVPDLDHPYTGPYFDGSTVITEDYVSYAWTGEPDASTSTKTIGDGHG